MKKTRYFDPYTANKRGRLVPTLADCWTCAESGVYLIRSNRTQDIVYVGSSSTQLKKTIYRHFQQWTDRQQSTGRMFDRHTFPKTGYQVRIIKTTPARALALEKHLIQKYKPKYNPVKYKNLTRAQTRAGERLEKMAAAAPTIAKKDYIHEPFDLF